MRGQRFRRKSFREAIRTSGCPNSGRNSTRLLSSRAQVYPQPRATSSRDTTYQQSSNCFLFFFYCIYVLDLFSSGREALKNNWVRSKGAFTPDWIGLYRLRFGCRRLAGVPALDTTAYLSVDRALNLVVSAVC